MPGPPPKPTQLKILQGNPGKRRLPAGEVKPPVGARMPDWLKKLNDPVLIAEWNKHAPRLTRLGLLTEIDDEALATLCVMEVKFRDQVGMAASGTALCETSRELRALWARFGMTPADRTRVKVEPTKPESKLERFRGGA